MEHVLAVKNDNPTEIELAKPIKNVSARADNDDIDDMDACNAIKLLDITASVTGEALMSINGPNGENPPKQGHKESKKSYDSAATPKSSNDRNPTQKHTTDIPSSSSRLKNKNRNEDDNNNPVTIIVGDSMIKGLRPDKISKSVKHKTQIKSFPGATVEDLNDYIKPSLKRKPKNIILHVGTNDLKRKRLKILQRTLTSYVNLSNQTILKCQSVFPKLSIEKTIKSL